MEDGKKNTHHHIIYVGTVDRINLIRLRKNTSTIYKEKRLFATIKYFKKNKEFPLAKNSFISL